MEKYFQLEIPFDYEEEEFKDIENYEGLYMISSLGRVYSVKRNKFLKPHKEKKNYLRVALCKEGKMKKYKIHRLVGQAFIPNPLNYKEINHINEIKTDNRVENLEWMSHKENCNYGTRTARMKQHPNWKAAAEKCSKAVLQFTKDGKFVKEYPSTIEAERATGIDHGSISKCCKEKLHSAGKYVWRYKKEVA
jgi:hypothetical protein